MATAPPGRQEPATTVTDVGRHEVTFMGDGFIVACSCGWSGVALNPLGMTDLWVEAAAHVTANQFDALAEPPIEGFVVGPVLT